MRTLEVLKCLSDLTRARIVHLLTHRGPELCVCDIVTTLALPQSTVSRQLMMLRYLGLVQDRRVDIWMHYSMAKPDSLGHQIALQLVKDGFKDEPMFLEDLRTFDALKKKGEVMVSCEDKEKNGSVRGACQKKCVKRTSEKKG